MSSELYGQAADAALAEVRRAKEKHGPKHFSGGHEAYGVLIEEVEEWWEHVKNDTVRSEDARKEAIQIAAMALRIAVEL